MHIGIERQKYINSFYFCDINKGILPNLNLECNTKFFQSPTQTSSWLGLNYNIPF